MLLTATHQEKMRYNKKLEAGGKVIKELAGQYNKIVAAINSAQRDALPRSLPRADVTFDQILAAEFPWLAEPRDGKPLHSGRSCALLSIRALLRLFMFCNYVEQDFVPSCEENFILNLIWHVL